MPRNAKYDLLDLSGKFNARAVRCNNGTADEENA